MKCPYYVSYRIFVFARPRPRLTNGIQKRHSSLIAPQLAMGRSLYNCLSKRALWTPTGCNFSRQGVRKFSYICLSCRSRHSSQQISVARNAGQFTSVRSKFVFIQFFSDYPSLVALAPARLAHACLVLAKSISCLTCHSAAPNLIGVLIRSA
jgi:hypothetical protein